MSFTQGLHRSLQQNPDAVAIIDGDREFTFAELADRVARVAGGLESLGVMPGDRIAIMASNCGEYFEYILVCSWLGVVASPINTRWSADEIACQIDEVDAAVILVDESQLSAALELRERCTSLQSIVCFGEADLPCGVIGYEELLAGSLPVPDRRRALDELAVILYTGGTTGFPKGVMLSEGQVLSAMWGVGMTTGLPNVAERAIWTGPFFHVSAYAGAVQQMILGSTHVILGDFDLERLAEVIPKHRVTMASLVPTTVKWLLDYAEVNDVDLSSLRILGYGAAPMPEPLVHRLKKRLPDVQLRQAYGMTELGAAATVLRDGDHRDPEHPERLRSVGRAAFHNEVRIVGPDSRTLAVGEVGEVIVRGPNVMMGYWRNDEETTKALRDGWMHTGDMGSFDEHGYLYLVDRLKDMIVTGGENVYSAEVERVLYLHESVASCAVIGVPDEDWGERVHGVVVLKPGAEISGNDLRDFVGQRIARYKAPRTFDFVSELPLSPAGKVLKRALREQYGR